MNPRSAVITRDTNETKIKCLLNLDGQGASKIETGIGFLNHLLCTLAKHARFDLELTCKGDLEVDDHHTAEDVALALGEALDNALENKSGIARFACAFAPLDESLARVVVDLSGRPFAVVNLELTRDMVGELACENVTHFLRSFATAAKLTLHADVLRGENDHHKAEAAFKALALALKEAVSLSGFGDVPSTKGAL